MKSGVYVFIGSMIIAIVVAVLMGFYNKKEETKSEDDQSETDSVASEAESESTEDAESETESETGEEDQREVKEPDVSIMPVEEEQDPGIEEPLQEIPPVIEDTTMASKQTTRMCVYTNQYLRCDTKCGKGKRFRVQVPYNDDLHSEQTPHVCVPDEDREFRPCTGIVCDETYTYPTFIKNNPGKGFTEYCEFIEENNACNDNYVRQNSLCSEQCPR